MFYGIVSDRDVMVNHIVANVVIVDINVSGLHIVNIIVSKCNSTLIVVKECVGLVAGVPKMCVIRQQNQRASLAAWVSDVYSAPVNNSATSDCFLAFHELWALRKKKM